MNNMLVQYLAESGISLGVFYVFYALVLSKQTCFGFNRCYLLAALVFSFLLPFLEISSYNQRAPGEVGVDTLAITSNTVTTTYEIDYRYVEMGPDKSFPYGLVFYVIYIIGFGIFLYQFCHHILKLYTFIYSHAPDAYFWQHIKIIPTQGELPTFSFLHYILFDNTQALTQTEKELVLAHEKVHLEQRHSLDILFIKFLRIIFWFNPLLYFYKNALETVHEYLADKKVMLQTDPATYATLLVNQVFQKAGFSLGNFFNLTQSSTLKRLTMMKNFNRKPRLYRQLLALPLLGILAITLASNAPISLPGVAKTSSLRTGIAHASVPIPEETTFINDSISATAPQFPGGPEELYRFLNKNLKYPAGDLADKAPYTWLMIDIKIDEDGNPEKQKSSGKDGFYDELFRVANLLPKFEPAKINGKPVASKYRLSVFFRHSTDTTKIEENKMQSSFRLEGGVPTFKGKSVIVTYTTNKVGVDRNNPKQPETQIQQSGNKAPSFSGGIPGIEKFMAQNFNYPTSGPSLNILGLRIIINGKINTTGRIEIKNIKIAQESDRLAGMEILESEIKRILSVLPPFKPALINGRPINTDLVFYITIFTGEITTFTETGSTSSLDPNNKTCNYIIRSTIRLRAPNSRKNQLKVAKNVAPQFPGGKNALTNYLAKNTNYPAQALVNKVTGQAIVQTTIDAEGNVGNLKILHADNTYFAQEALRVLKEMPRWQPGTRNDHPVAYNLVFPFVFGMQSNKNLPPLRLPVNLNTLTILDATNVVGYTNVIAGRTVVQHSTTPAKKPNKSLLIKEVPPLTIIKYPLHKPETPTNSPASVSKDIPEPTVIDDKIFTFVEVPAAFPGGDAALNNFIKSNLKYSPEAAAAKIQGRVILQFVVGSDGVVRDPAAVGKTLGYGLEDEAIRVVKLMPKWEPAKQNGKPVGYRFTMPVNFKMN